MTVTVSVVAALCVAEVCTMTGVATWPALLPLLQAHWTISNTIAGSISGAFFAGYMAAVPLLASLTDRVPARRVYVGSCALLTVGSLALSRAGGPPLAIAAQALLGAGLAGTYMPGLKELSDRISGPRQARAIAVYTSTYGLGTSLSLYLAGAIAARGGWRIACAASAAGPPLAAAILLALPGHRAAPPGRIEPLPRFRAVLADRRVRTYVFGYAAHCCELFALRSWMVAFFTFANAGAQAVAPSTSAALLNLLGPPASITGNEIAARRRMRAVAVTMGASATLALATGAAGLLGGVVVIVVAALYVLAIMADSAALTAGLVQAAQPAARGTAMAVYSFFGFAGGLAGPVVFGALLDLGGGSSRAPAWLLAFTGLALVSASAATVLARASHRDETPAAASR